jgi:hypothetical protein
MTTKARREHLADEIGSANVVLVAEGYRQGWLDAMHAARDALAGTKLPARSDAALQAWLDEPGPRFRLSGAALDIADGYDEHGLPNTPQRSVPS